jgi:glycyl-tRNA synthetase
MIAPVKTLILSLISNNGEHMKYVHKLKSKLNKEGVSSKVDDSYHFVGRRYARTDECGIPIAITIDTDILKDDTITLRELHSMKQIRIPISNLSATILDLSKGLATYQKIQKVFPEFA